MALIKAGGLAGQISGRIGANVWSHNRYGSYVRNGTIPVTSTTPYALAAKARMTQCTQAWQSLTAAQKLAWNAWAVTNPTRNRLGDTIVLTGHAAYVSLNCRITSFGFSLITDPPIVPAPGPLTALSLSADIGPGGFDMTFAPTPLGADESLYVWGCVVDSTGINYIANYLRWFAVTAAAQASPFDPEGGLTGRFGQLQEDQIVHLQVSVVRGADGQVSNPLRCQATVVDTTP